MGYYEAGPKTDTPPVILCHAGRRSRSWRHQIKALGDAGIRVIAPTSAAMARRPAEPIEAYDIEHLTGDLVGLLDHSESTRRFLSGTTGALYRLANAAAAHRRVAGVVGINTPQPTARRRIRSNCYASVSAST